MFNEMQGKIICKSVDCDVWRAFNLTTTNLDLQEPNVKANYTSTIAKNTSGKYEYSTCVQIFTFFLFGKRGKKNAADS